MKAIKFGIIGVGKMGSAFAQGLLAKKLISPSNLYLFDSTSSNLKSFRKSKINIAKNNSELTTKSDVILLAVKPDSTESVCKQIADRVTDKKIVISIAAGVRIRSIERWLGNKKSGVVRVMPNIPLQVGEGMNCWTTSRNVSSINKTIVKKILGNLGVELYLNEESDLDKITAISGSGPAYFYYLVECLQESAEEIGLSKSDSQLLVRQTFLGSSELLAQSGLSAEELRKAVMSKGGTTEAALDVLEKRRVKLVVKEAVKAAFARSRELGQNKTYTI